jgi:hypothetical protein
MSKCIYYTWDYTKVNLFPYLNESLNDICMTDIPLQI